MDFPKRVPERGPRWVGGGIPAPFRRRKPAVRGDLENLFSGDSASRAHVFIYACAFCYLAPARWHLRAALASLFLKIFSRHNAANAPREAARHEA